MAFEMEYTDSYGETYPKSYWRVEQVNRDKKHRMGQLTFHGYASEEKKGGRVIGEKHYSLMNPDFDAYFTANVLNPKDSNPDKKAYEFASNKLEGIAPVEGEDTRKSFFDGAKEV